MPYIKKLARYFNFSFKPLIGVGLLVIAVLGYLAINFYKDSNSVNKEATLLLSFENGGRGRMFQGEVVEGMTIFGALLASSNAGQIELKYSSLPDNKVNIEDIDGYDASKSDKKLYFYLNGTNIKTEDINSVFIEGGDRIEVRLQ